MNYSRTKENMVRSPESVEIHVVHWFEMRNFVDVHWIFEFANWCMGKWVGLGIETPGIISFLPSNRLSVAGQCLLEVLVICGCEAVGKTSVVT